ncbi:hypothetical protein CPB86DRAFT_878414 [Serendipita vermifera]|nr:hypothetical protein CPB86DRAFT_878414 [Serendipita vermifera]
MGMEVLRFTSAKLRQMLPSSHQAPAVKLFVIVNGVPSVGVKVMLGTGILEDQPLHDIEPLPESSIITELTAGDDCFSFAESDKERVYTLVAAAAEGNSINVLLLQDVNDRASAKKKEHGDEPPTIISASGSSKWGGKRINTAKTARLGLLTDMGLELERIPWSLNLERILPGTQSSNMHAHSSEDEFVLVLSGKARYWHQGMTPEPILRAGDCVRWRAGTGICHSLLNDGEDENGACTPTHSGWITAG